MDVSTKRQRWSTALVPASNLRLRQSLPYRAVSKAVAITRNLRRHVQLSQVLGGLGLLNQHDFYAGIRYRYLRKYYLGNCFSISQRVAAAINHHQSIDRHFRPHFLRTARQGGHGVWSTTVQDTRFDITLRYPYHYNHDGDLSLSFDVNGTNVCIVTFSIVPGALAGLSETHVLLVAGIQGIAGRIGLIRQATELCNNVSPAHMLLFAAQTLGQQMGIKTMVGLGQGRADSAPDTAQQASFDYDAFWMHLVGLEQRSDFYPIALPLTDKPIESIPAKHRGRARKRRELRNLIRHEIETSTQAKLEKDCFIENENYTLA